MKWFYASIRVILVTQLLCVIGYLAVVWGFARVVVPEKAVGSPQLDGLGRVVGSRLIGQEFTKPIYFWSRPSAGHCDASASGGSNLSPTSEALRTRAVSLVAAYGTTEQVPVPAELVAASGSGLDPHISARAAYFQAARVATARGMSLALVRELIRRHTVRGVAAGDLVNVLELNLALDEWPKTAQIQ